jgi:flagellar biogenesis protein FliO
MAITFADEATDRCSPPLGDWIQGMWAWLVRHSRREPRSLRLCESLPLGDRRFVAVVEYQQTRFLLGGTSNSLVMLARLECGLDSGPRPDTLGAAKASAATGSTEEAKEQRG